MSRRSARGATGCACYEPDAERFGRIALGIPYVEFDVPPETVDGIVAFYRQIVDVPAEATNGDGKVARVMIGKNQHLQFRETEQPPPDFDGHHIAIYVVNFSGPHGRLNERNLVSQEDNPYQYRFRDIADPETGRKLFTIEHEVRSVSHPMFMRPLVNRNPTQNNRNYAAGYQESPLQIEPELYDPPSRTMTITHQTSDSRAGRPIVIVTALSPCGRGQPQQFDNSAGADVSAAGLEVDALLKSRTDSVASRGSGDQARAGCCAANSASAGTNGEGGSSSGFAWPGYPHPFESLSSRSSPLPQGERAQ